MVFVARLFLSVTLCPILGAYSGYRLGIFADSALSVPLPSAPFWLAVIGGMVGLWLAVRLTRCARRSAPAPARFLAGLVVATLAVLGIADLMWFRGAQGWWATAAERHTPFIWAGCVVLGWMASRAPREGPEELGENEDWQTWSDTEDADDEY